MPFRIDDELVTGLARDTTHARPPSGLPRSDLRSREIWTWSVLPAPGRSARAPQQLVDQPVGADRLVGVEQEEGEQRALPAAAQRDHTVLVEDHDRAEDEEVHGDGGGAGDQTYPGRGEHGKRAKGRAARAPLRSAAPG